MRVESLRMRLVPLEEEARELTSFFFVACEDTISQLSATH